MENGKGNLELASALSESCTQETIECIGNLVEIGVDELLPYEILKEIPFISTAISAYNIGKSIHERHYISKLAIFLNTIADKTAKDKDIEARKEKYLNNKEKRNKELEYLLVLIDRYIQYEKPEMLAKLYIAYLEQKIDWRKLTIYAEIVDRLLPGDYELLCSNFPPKQQRFLVDSGFIRLESLGLVFNELENYYDDKKEGTLVLMSGIDCHYALTSFGNELIQILQK